MVYDLGLLRFGIRLVREPRGPASVEGVQVRSGQEQVRPARDVVVRFHTGNPTRLAATAGGYASVDPTGIGKPATSNINRGADDTLDNFAITPAGTGGQISIYSNSDGTAGVVVDSGGDPVRFLRAWPFGPGWSNCLPLGASCAGIISLS
ncbi:hypothetical protein [Streptomyces sp. GbtcB6]|uniref:hypothetical protein n=1 Tax=Streptomyces sp. GbtcB6 TaxID=2824751 RepID=UPI001C30226E|nr:hypothetical protein [Streptomyces sp. GbtcB6]